MKIRIEVEAGDQKIVSTRFVPDVEILAFRNQEEVFREETKVFRKTLRRGIKAVKST